MWAYDRQIQLIGIIRCFEAGCQSQSEMAEFWDVTEEFMIILSVAGLIVSILNTRKNPALQDSPPAAGRASDIFHSAAVRSSRSVFMS